MSVIGTTLEEIAVDLAYVGHSAVEEELNRLAGKIHGGLTQHLSAICMQALRFARRTWGIGRAGVLLAYHLRTSSWVIGCAVGGPSTNHLAM